jgi:hypothetical protein
MVARSVRFLSLGVLTLLLTLGLGARVLTAQEATPVGTPVGALGELLIHPAHIHSGTCAELGPVVYPLNDVIEVLDAATPVATPPTALQQATPPADATPGVLGEVDAEAGFFTIVEVTLEELLATEHAINVHESPETIEIYLACGEITGEPVDGQLEIELAEQQDSGYRGRALLTDNGDGTTTVILALERTAAAATPAP